MNWGQIKLWAMVALAAVAAFFRLRYLGEKNKRLQENVNDQKKVNEIVMESVENVTEGEQELQNELKKIDSAIDHNDFSGMQ